MSDSTPIRLSDAEKADDVGSLVSSIWEKINFKMLILLFITFVGLSSDVFCRRVLSHVDGAIDGKCPTNKGVFIQALLLCLAYVIFEILIVNDIL